jgi:hypothetical protein
MPGWDSLETVARIHDGAQIAGLILLVLLLVGAVFLFVQLRRSGWPEWIDVGSYQVRSLACEIAAAVLLALLVGVALVVAGYGARQTALMVAAGQAHADQARRLAGEGKDRQADETKGHQANESKARQAPEVDSHQAGDADARRPAENSALRQQLTEFTNLQRKLSETENQRAELQRKLSENENRLAELQRKPSEADSQVTELQRKLTEAETRLAEVHRKEMKKRLSEEEKQKLIEALKPFAGQKVAVASRLGDEDGKSLAEDFVAVFDAARWDHGGNGGISVQRWDRDPVGIEITLNEADARAGRISSGIGALINVVRKLGLSYDNTIYMNRQVPSGQALVKVGRKLTK